MRKQFLVWSWPSPIEGKIGLVSVFCCWHSELLQFRGLEQHKVIILQFWMSDMAGLTGIKSVLVGLCLYLKALGEKLFPAHRSRWQNGQNSVSFGGRMRFLTSPRLPARGHSQLLEAAHIPELIASMFKSNHRGSNPQVTSPWPTSLPAFSTCKKSCN